MSDRFEAIVTRPIIPRRFDKDGVPLEFTAVLLGDRAKQIYTDQLEALNKAADGELEIINCGGTPLILQTARVCSVQGVHTVVNRLRHRMEQHLDLVTTVQ